MSIDVYLSPAYHRANPCCFNRPDGKPCYETLHNNEYLDVLERHLQAAGITYARGTRRVPMSNEDGTALMNAAIADSNRLGVKVHYVSHTNASTNGTARGCHFMYYLGSTEGYRLCELAAKYRKGIYPAAVLLVPRPSDYGGNLAELKDTKAVAIYNEHVFHDNAADAKWFHSHYEAVAAADTKALCEYLGKEYHAPPKLTLASVYGVQYTKDDGAAFYLDGREVTPKTFIDALAKMLEE